MRFLGLAVAASAAIMLGACGGGDKPAADSVGASTAAAPAAAPEAPAMAGTMSPITGTTHEVKMRGDATGYRFEPAEITVKTGDGIKFVFVDGGPHNLAFDPAVFPAAAKSQMMANMPEQVGELSGKMLLAAGEEYTVSFGGIPAGTYDGFCTPHLAMNMKIKINVQ